jgi:hypothetical protein
MKPKADEIDTSLGSRGADGAQLREPGYGIVPGGEPNRPPIPMETTWV